MHRNGKDDRAFATVSTPSSFRRTRRSFAKFLILGFLLASGLALSLVYLSVNGVAQSSVVFASADAEEIRAISIYVAASILLGISAAFMMIFALGRHMVLSPLIDLRRSEVRLRESEAHARRLALVAEKASDLVIIYDDCGQIMWVNAAFVKTTGYQPGEVIGRKPGELLSGDKVDLVTGQRIETAMRKGEAVSAQLINYSKSGREYLVEANISPVRDEDGTLTNFIAVERDITERHMAERRLREAIEIIEDGFSVYDADDRLIMFNSGYESVLGLEGELSKGMSLVEIVEKLDRNGDIELGGVTIEEWAAKRSREIRAEEGAPSYQRLNGKALMCRSKSTSSGELVSLRTDVTELHEARRRVEEAAEVKSRFFANITHEVRTPMNGVIAMAELLLEGDLTEQQRSGVELISQSGSSLLTIINDILDYSKIEAGKMSIQTAPFDVVEAIEDVVALLSPEATKRGNEIAFQFDPALPRLISGDHGRIRQIATNLIGNAIKFTNGGVIVAKLKGRLSGQDVQLTFEVEDSGIGIPAGHLEMIFQPFEQSGSGAKQNGTGLGLSICHQLADLMGGRLSATSTPEVGSIFRFAADFPVLDAGEQLNQLFSMNDRVALFGASPQAEALSAQIESLGGSIATGKNVRGADVQLSVVSLLNDGAAPAGLDFAPDVPAIIVAPVGVAPPDALIRRFKKGAKLVRRPIRTGILASSINTLIGRNSPQIKRDEDRRKAPRSGDGPLVIVAEDNATNAAIIRAMLADQNLTVEIYADATGAIEAFERKSPALVIMDIYLPDMNGLEAAERIRAIEEMEQREATPIIAATASSSTDDRAGCLKAGMNDFITKPLNKAQLQAKVRYWMSRSQDLAAAG